MEISSFTDGGYEDGLYVLPPLPYNAAALEAVLDAETVRLHHGKHHAAYVAGANSAAAQLRLISLAERDENEVAEATQKLTFNLSGHILHCLYWHSLSPVSQVITMTDAAAAICRQFGSYDGFCRVFKSAALSVQGNGWAVLGLDLMSGRLVVNAVQNHQNALLPGLYPILACDVWEHAYYLRYRNNRAAYVEAFMRHIDWVGVARRYNNITLKCHECR